MENKYAEIEEASIKSGFKGFILGFVIGALILFAVMGVLWKSSMNEWRHEIVSRGHAEWGYDGDSRKLVFKWKN